MEQTTHRSGHGSAPTYDELLAKVKHLEAEVVSQAKDFAMQNMKLEKEVQPLRTKLQAFDASLKEMAEVEQENASLKAQNEDLQREVEELKNQNNAAPASKSNVKAKPFTQKQFDHVKRELEGLKKKNANLKDINRILTGKIEKANEHIEECRLKIITLITDIDLSMTGWTVCICVGEEGSTEHIPRSFNPLILSVDLFDFVRRCEDCSFVEMHDDYRKHLIEHHNHDHGSQVKVQCWDENCKKDHKIPTGDVLREFFTEMDGPRNFMLDYWRKTKGVDLGTVGNY